MKKKNSDHSNVCPGCSRHCTADAVRCKRGQRYFEELKAGKIPDGMKMKKRKWEKYVADDSPLRMLLLTGRRIKKALRSGVSEEQLQQTLSAEERTVLKALLQKIESNIEKDD